MCILVHNIIQMDSFGKNLKGENKNDKNEIKKDD